MITREQFYKTKEWVKIRKLVLIKSGYICNRCSNPAKYVHHIEYLTDDNYLDINVSLNESNLEALCMECHNEEHNPSNSTRQGLKFNDSGDLIVRK